MLEQPEQQSLQSWKSRFRSILETVEMIVLALVLYFLIDSVVARVQVQKISMVPTLVPGDVLLVNKLAYKFSEMEYGDIITFHYPIEPDLDYVKRLIGKPGDEVIVKDGNVWVNGKLLYEPYISAAPEYDGTWQIPDDGLFVLGDNRNPSADSHVWGFVPVENVIGKVFAVYWPLNKIHGISTPNIFAADQ